MHPLLATACANYAGLWCINKNLDSGASTRLWCINKNWTLVHQQDSGASTRLWCINKNLDSGASTRMQNSTNAWQHQSGNIWRSIVCANYYAFSPASIPGFQQISATICF